MSLHRQDKNGDGSITHVEFINGLRKNAWIAALLGMAACMIPGDLKLYPQRLPLNTFNPDTSELKIHDIGSSGQQRSKMEAG